MNSVPGSVFGRWATPRSTAWCSPDQHHLHVQLRRQRPHQKLFNSLSVAYIVFAGLAFLSILLILALQDHKYDQDYMAAHKQ